MAYVHPGLLIVDDDPLIRDQVSAFVRREGYVVETAANGRAALTMLRRWFQPCVILLDLMMPEMDGFEFRQEQMADRALAMVPVITYSSVRDLATHAQQLGVTAYIHKPAALDTIMSLVRQHCLK